MFCGEKLCVNNKTTQQENKNDPNKPLFENKSNENLSKEQKKERTEKLKKEKEEDHKSRKEKFMKDTDPKIDHFDF